MANVLQTINNQLEFICTGYRPIETYFVDDSYTTGVKAFRFSHIKSDGTVKSKSELSLQYADARSTALLPAQGFFYDTSIEDRYRRGDDITPETMLLPKGARENKGMGFAKKGEMIIVDDANFDLVKYFRGIDEVLVDASTSSGINVVTGTSAVTINVDVDLTGDLAVGDWITINNDTTSDTVQVLSLTASAITTNTNIANNYNGSTKAVTITALTMVNRPIYLIEADQSGSVFPFQTLVPVTSGNLKQQVGYTSSQGTYVIDLSIDPNGSVVA